MTAQTKTKKGKNKEEATTINSANRMNRRFEKNVSTGNERTEEKKKERGKEEKLRACFHEGLVRFVLLAIFQGVFFLRMPRCLRATQLNDASSQSSNEWRSPRTLRNCQQTAHVFAGYIEKWCGFFSEPSEIPSFISLVNCKQNKAHKKEVVVQAAIGVSGHGCFSCHFFLLSVD